MKIFTLVIVMVSSVSVYAPIDSAEPGRYLESSLFCSTRCEAARAKNFQDPKWAEDQLKHRDSVAAQIKRMNDDYIENVSKVDPAWYLLKANNYMVGGIASLVPVVGKLMKDLLDKVENDYQLQKKQIALNVWHSRLPRLRAEMGTDFDTVRNSTDLKFRAARLRASTRAVLASDLNKLDPLLRDQIHEELLKVIVDAIDSLAGQAVYADARISELEKYVELARSHNDWRRTRNDVVAMAPSEPTEAAADMRNQVSPNAPVTSNIKQIAANQRKQMNQWGRTALEGSHAAQRAGTIFSNLGNEDLAQGANVIAGALDVVGGLFLAQTPMGLAGAYLNAGAYLTSFIQKKQPDVTQAMFKALTTIYEEIQKNHKEVLQQFAILHGAVSLAIDVGIENIESEVRPCAQLLPPNLMAKGSPNIEADWYSIAYNEVSPRLFASDDVWTQCKLGLSRNFTLPDYGPLGQVLPQYRLVPFLNRQPGSAETVDKNVTQLDQLHSIHYDFLSKTVAQKYWSLLTTPAPTPEAILEKLRSPEKFIRQTSCMEQMLKADDGSWQTFFSKWFPEPLNSSLVTRLSLYLLPVHPYFELAELEQQTRSRKHIQAQLDRTSETALKYLCYAEWLVTTSMAQQTLLSGDILLPVFYWAFTGDSSHLKMLKPYLREEVLKDDKHRHELWIEAIQLFDKNPMLAHNFIVYAFIYEQEKTKFVNANYEFAMGIKRNSVALKQLLPGLHWWFVYREAGKRSDQSLIPEGWTVKFNDSSFYLAAADQLNSGLFPSLSGYYLQRLKQLLVGEIATYNHYNRKPVKGCAKDVAWDKSPSDACTLRKALLLGASPK